jgi:hypothetical protein
VRTQAWTRDITAGGELALGARSGLFGRVQRQYQPVFLFGAFDALPGLVEGTTPDFQTVQGVTRQTWQADESSVGLYRNFTRRQVADFRIGRRSQRPLRGFGLDNATDSALAHYAWTLGRTGGLDFNYQYVDTTQTSQPGAGQRLSTHALFAGFHVRRRVSPSRSLDFAISGGVSRSTTTLVADQSEGEIFQPTFSASFGTQLTRSWSIRAEAGRQVGVLYGLTPEPFATRAMSIGATGNLSRRLQANLSVAYSRGDAALSKTDSYDTMYSTNSLQYALSRNVAMFVNYTYYRQTLDGVTVVQPLFPGFYERHSTRVGASIWLPVLGRR